MRIILYFRVSKWLLISVALFLSNLAFANDCSYIKYSITPYLTKKPYVNVGVEITGSFSFPIIIDLPYKWAGTDYRKQIKNIKFANSNYQYKIQQNKDTFQLVITASDNLKSLKFSYDVHQKYNNPSDVMETIVRPHLIHTTGYGFLALPNDFNNKNIKANINWENIPNNWKIISSHGIGNNINFIGSPKDLLHAFYIAGDVRLYQIMKGQTPVYLSLYGNFGLPDVKIIANTKKTIEVQRRFFKDYNFPYYLISNIEGDDHYSMGGTALKNSFAAFLPVSMDAVSSNILLAHEHFHNWTGGKIQKADEELDYWWSEGFTEYYSRVLALRARQISLDTFIEECNNFFSNYYLSKVKNASNIKIKQEFWSNYDIHKLPYSRGFVLAIYLNNLIKRYDKNKSLDNVMLELFAEHKNKKFSIDLFKKILSKYIPEYEVERIIRLYVVEGQTINLAETSKYLPIEEAYIGSYEPGFDTEVFKRDRLIKGLKIDSRAYEAGLREGDKIIEWDIPKGYGYSDQIVTVKTSNNKVVKFRPENSDKNLVYKFKNNLSAKEKRLIWYQ